MRTIIITGANSGIGLETTKHFAAEGDTVIAASRPRPETLQLVEELNQQFPLGKVVFYELDLMDLASVRRFAEKVAQDFTQIDILICNAGIMNAPYRLTVDGYESHFQTNFLSHFLLTRLLSNIIQKTEWPKVINVCSASAEKGKIHSIPELAAISRVSESDYDALTSYRESKLAQETVVFQLARTDSTIKYSLVHPGVVNSNLFYRGKGNWYKALMKPFVWLGYAFNFFLTPEEGAKTSIYLAENNDYPSGKYWHNQEKLTPNPISQDTAYQDDLRRWADEQLGLA